MHTRLIALATLLLTPVLTSQKLTGKVVGPDGKPVAGARLELVDDTLSAMSQTMRQAQPIVGATQPDGSFELSAADMVPLVGYSLFVVTDEHDDHRTLDLVRPQKTLDLGTITLRRGADATGTVVDGKQRPIAGAIVRWWPEQGWSAGLELAPSRVYGWQTRTDAKGHYRLRNLPATRGIVHASKVDYTVDSRPINASVDMPWTERLVLFAAKSQRGVVRDAAGKPVKNAVLVFKPGNALHTVPMALARTNEKGEYAIHVPNRHGTAIAVQLGGRWRGSVPPKPSFTASNWRGDAELFEFKSLTFRVSAPNAKLNRVAARTLSDSNSAGIFQWIELRDGVGKLPVGPPSGRVRIEVRVPGLGPGFSKQQTYTFRQGFPRPPEFQIELKGGCHLRGRFVDESGKPLAGIPLDLHAGRISSNRKVFPYFKANYSCTPLTTDADGRFEIGGLGATPYQLVAQRDGFAMSFTQSDFTAKQEVDLGDITMVRTIEISGEVTINGKPAANAVVSLSSRNSNRRISISSSARGHTDASGRFTLAERLPPGEYSVYARVGDAKLARRQHSTPYKIRIPAGKKRFSFPIRIEQR